MGHCLDVTTTLLSITMATAAAATAADATAAAAVAANAGKKCFAFFVRYFYLLLTIFLTLFFVLNIVYFWFKFF